MKQNTSYIRIMEVVGYAARFCTAPGCDHNASSDCCCNVIDSKYYINSSEELDIVGVPLVVGHNNRHVVGSCIRQNKTAEGILLVCQIDDVYFLDSLRRRFDEFKENYNASIPNFETFCKKTLCSFSLSHNRLTKHVKHVSLVDTPGRIGTAVIYKTKPGLLFKRRPDNYYISDIIATHSTAFSYQGDRKKYLLQNDSFSHSPGDLSYINAQRDLSNIMPQSNQEDFETVLRFFKIYKSMNDNDDCKGRNKDNNLKRNRQQDNYDVDDDNMGLSKVGGKRGKCCEDDVTASAPREEPHLDNAKMLEVMMENTKQLKQLTTSLQTSILQQTFQQAVPTEHPEPTTSNATSPIAPPTQVTTAVEVEASRPRTTIITTTGGANNNNNNINHEESIKNILKLVMGC